MFDYWQECPPTHVLVAAYLLGGKKSPRGKGAREQTGGLDELATAVHIAGGGVKGKLPGSYRSVEIGQA
ncbi:MAG TPA: hypothetical protein VJ723_12745 [Candidatus Angelobacter sp.]|nr:hypothetical protein [Candidatus Angelobacter sp.]